MNIENTLPYRGRHARYAERDDDIHLTVAARKMMVARNINNEYFLTMNFQIQNEIA